MTRSGPYKKGSPGCPCCGPCDIDQFADETEITADTIGPAEHPQSPYPAWLQADVKAEAGDAIKLFLAWDDSTPGDGLYVEFAPQNGTTQGTLKLYRKGGSQIGDTLSLICATASTADADYWHRITVCYDPDDDKILATFDASDQRGYVVLSQCIAEEAPSGFSAGRKAGYGGTGWIRNYNYDRLWYCGESPYTSDCHAEGDYYDYYYDLPARTVCHSCACGCTVIAEDFSEIEDDGYGFPGGDMPCGWDASATNWQVVDGAATGDGSIFHEYELVSQDFIVSATFHFGALAVDGDSVTVSLIGSSTLSATLRRVSASNYTLAYSLGLPGESFASQPTAVTLRACPNTVYGNTVTPHTGSRVSIITSQMGVGITQPTGAGSERSSMTGFTISKHANQDTDCPSCAFSCSQCDFGDYMYVDLGPQFLYPQRTCGTCASLQGTFGAPYYNSICCPSVCQWFAGGIGCDCTHPTCSGTGKYVTWYLRIFVRFLYTGRPQHRFEVQVGITRIADPGDWCMCGGCACIYYSDVFDSCESYPASGITLSEVTGTECSGGEGLECLGTFPSQITLWW